MRKQMAEQKLPLTGRVREGRDRQGRDDRRHDRSTCD